MQLNIKNIFLYNDETFKKNNIDDEKYELIIYCSLKERQICGDIRYDKTRFLYEKSLELIKSYDIFINRNINFTPDMNSLPSINHRKLLKFETLLQKQIFINNFIFPENESFINCLINCNISIDNIIDFKNKIEEKKLTSKIDHNYTLDIDLDSFHLDELCNFYGCKYPSLILNKMFELYYKNPELFSRLSKKR